MSNPSNGDATQATSQINGQINGLQDGVYVAAPSGIKVLIVGAGIGGLTAALECHRRGHAVQILERTPSASAEGDMFNISLSARRWIKHYPTMACEFNDISIHDGYMQYRKWSGEAIGEPQLFATLLGGGMKTEDMPMVTQIRPLWHAMLHHQAKRFGIEVLYGRKAYMYFENAERGVGGVLTDQGERFEADVVLAADGLHSKSQDIVLGGQGRGRPSGHSVFRGAFPLEIAMRDPLVAETFGLVDGHSRMTAQLGPDTHCMTVSYVDKNGENGWFCWGLAYEESGEQSRDESWSHTVSSEEVLAVMDRIGGWNEATKRLVQNMPERSTVLWPILWRDPNPCTHSQHCRVLQIGDAAHSFLPTSGNGATQAIEDAITIAACLQHAGAADVPLAVKTHNLLRSDRVSCAQLLGFYNAQRLHKSDLKSVGSDSGKVNAKMPKWIWTSDPEAYADENFASAAASLQEGGPEFKNTNIPTGFEPKPWSLESIQELEKEGKGVELSGDWS